MKEESRSPRIEPELEARIVALVLGEASDFERDELNRLIAERAELAALIEQIQDVHGLLRGVGTDESVADNDDWKLSVENRRALLAVFDGEVEEQSANQVIEFAEKRDSARGSFFWKLTKIAAVFCFIGFLGLMTMPTVNLSRSHDSVRLRQLASNDTKSKTRDSKGASTLWGKASAAPSDEALLRNDARINMNSASIDSAGAGGTAEPVTGTELDYGQNSRSALSAIRESLSADASASSPNDNEGPGATLGQDVGGPPAVDLDLKLDAGSFGATKPSVGGFDVGPASRDGVDGPEPSSRQTAGKSSRLSDHEPKPNELFGEVDRPTDSQPTVQKPASGELSLPSYSLNSGQLNFSDVEQSVGSTRSVPDRGTVLLGGVKRPTDNRGETPGLGHENKLSHAVTPKLGGTRLVFPVDGGEAEADGDNDYVNGESVGGGRYGGGRGGLAGQSSAASAREDELGQGVSAQHQPPYVSANASGIWVDNDGQAETPPSQPRVADIEDRTEAADVDKVFDVEAKQGELRFRDRLAIKGGSYWRGYVPHLLEDNFESTNSAVPKKSVAPAGLNEKIAKDEAFSTFSLHVSDVSFKLAQAALARGEWPEAAKIRIEEFVNAFDYGDPLPNQDEKVACCLEQSIHPFLQQRNLLRVSMRTAVAGRSSSTPLRLTLLLDNSGSMERPDRQQTVRRAFALLTQQLKPIDQVTLISFSRQPRLLADKVSGAESHQLVQLIENLPSAGGTNIEAALQLAFEKAQEQQIDGAQNRIILLTDGAVNLGDANPESLSRMITMMRNAGVAFDAAGISADGLNDEILEALTRQGDGRYYLLDSLEAADDGFARQIAGALRPSAKNVKVQVEFNPKRVGHYKLLGFEKHRLKQEDFRNDQVDAAELAAAEAGVAVYQFEAKPDGEGDVGSMSVRFRDLSTGQMVENRWPIPYEADAPRPDQAAPSLRIATAAAMLAAKLRGEPLGGIVVLKTLSDLIAGLPDRDHSANRVPQLQLMIQQARQMSGE